MRRKDYLTISVTLLFLSLIAGYYFLYNIYEIKVEVTPDHLYADKNSKVKLEVIPINALGSKAIFRSIQADFEIIEGRELIEVVLEDNFNCVIEIKSKGNEGKVGIKIYSQYSLFPQYVEILILPLRV